MSHYVKETAEERVVRADKFAEWIKRPSNTLPKMEVSRCGGCDKTLSHEETTYRLRGTAALVVCDECIEFSTVKSTFLDGAIADSFEMARMLSKQLRRCFQ